MTSLLAGLLLTSLALAQSAPPDNLTGQQLRNWLKTNWYDGLHRTLGYDGARQQMFGYVDAVAGKVACVYTGYTVNSGFTTTLGNVNTEHTIPQSFFNEKNPMRSDIHHLFPTHETANNIRGNLPFGEIPDNQTEKWLGSTQGGSNYVSLTTKPSSNADLYSEWQPTLFEPREDHKGNVARAVFYFYTMYPTEAGSITRLGNLDTLYKWHLIDPVDQAERERNSRIAQKQGNKNPYIEYPEIVGRAWGFVSPPCVRPSEPVANFSVSRIVSGVVELNINWQSAYKTLVLVKKNPFTQADFPKDGIAYPVDDTRIATWREPDRRFVVFSGTGNSVKVFDTLELTSPVRYKTYVAAFSYDCDNLLYQTNTYALDSVSYSNSLSHDISQAGIRIYPNPGQIFTIELPPAGKTYTFGVISLDGRILHTQKISDTIQLNLELPAGIYSIYFDDGAQIYRSKIIRL